MAERAPTQTRTPTRTRDPTRAQTRVTRRQVSLKDEKGGAETEGDKKEEKEDEKDKKDEQEEKKTEDEKPESSASLSRLPYPRAAEDAVMEMLMAFGEEEFHAAVQAAKGHPLCTKYIAERDADIEIAPEEEDYPVWADPSGDPAEDLRGWSRRRSS